MTLRQETAGRVGDDFAAVGVVAGVDEYTWDSTVQKMSDEQFQAMLDVYLVAPFRIMRAAA